MLTPADKTVLTNALHALKVMPEEGARLREILAIDTSLPGSPDKLQTLLDYVTDPANPGGGTVSRGSLSIENFRTLLVAADMVVGSKDAATQNTYNQVVSNLSGLVTIPLTDEAWQAFMTFLVNSGLVSASRLAAFTTTPVSLAELALGRIPTREELSSVVWTDKGEQLI